MGVSCGGLALSLRYNIYRDAKQRVPGHTGMTIHVGWPVQVEMSEEIETCGMVLSEYK